MINSVPGATKLYFLQGANSAGLFCSLSFVFYFVGDKILSNRFKDEINPSLKANKRLKFAQDVE